MTAPSPAAPRPSALQRLRQQAAYYLLAFIEGDHAWGQARSTGFAIVVLAYWLISRLFEPIGPIDWYQAWLTTTGLREQVPAPALQLVELLISFFLPQTLRHLIPPIAGGLLAMYFGALYLRDLLELPDLAQAYSFLTATLFGGPYPRLRIRDGQATTDDPETNPMLKIGGPGWVDIHLGNAALFERFAGPSAVFGSGTHFVHRFETLREAFDLRELERARNDIQIATKDGIPLVLTEVRARFRLRARERPSEANPYPVWTNSVRQAVYTTGRKVGEKGLDAWADAVTGAVVGTISGWLARRQMDELIPPPPDLEHPDAEPMPPYRKKLHNLFKEPATRQKFADMGAEIIWVSVGHLRPDPNVDPDLPVREDPAGRDKIHAQLIDTWRSTHEAMAREEITSARGYAKWLEDTARAQVQADLILGITTGMTEARSAGLPMTDLVTNRVIEYIATHSIEPASGEGDKRKRGGSGGS